MIDYRSKEVSAAVDEYIKSVERLNFQKIEILRQENEAWKALVLVLYADDPRKIQEYFVRRI